MPSNTSDAWDQDPGLLEVQEQVFMYLTLDNRTALHTIRARSFVGSPEIRGTMTILWSCIITLIACLYTALHLNVPGDTKAFPMLREKFKWVIIGLVAPEIVLYLASSQFLEARHLSKELTRLWRQQHQPDGASGVMLTDSDEQTNKEVRAQWSPEFLESITDFLRTRALISDMDSSSLWVDSRST